MGDWGNVDWIGDRDQCLVPAFREEVWGQVQGLLAEGGVPALGPGCPASSLLEEFPASYMWNMAWRVSGKKKSFNTGLKISALW